MEIGKLLSEALGMPAYLEHDVNAMALHQLELGQSRNFMLLFIDIGIGAAVMSGGKLLGNSKYFTGKLGHTSIRFDGRQCECGNRGCLETYASIPALLEGSPYHSWFDFIDHVDREEEARRLLDQEAVYLSAGLVESAESDPLRQYFPGGGHLLPLRAAGSAAPEGDRGQGPVPGQDGCPDCARGGEPQCGGAVCRRGGFFPIFYRVDGVAIIKFSQAS